MCDGVQTVLRWCGAFCCLVCLTSCNRLPAPVDGAIAARTPLRAHLTELRSALSTAGAPLRCHFPIPVAHRGGRDITTPISTENSLQLFRAALERGVRLIETDVRRTREGIFFLYHDRRLDRGRVEAPDALFGFDSGQLSDAQLAQLGLAGHPELPLPRLRTALSLGDEHPVVYLLDLKGDVSSYLPLLASELQSSGATDRSVLQLERRSDIELVRRNFPAIGILARAGNRKKALEFLRFRPEFLQGEEEWEDAELVAAAHAAGSLLLMKALGDSDSAAAWRRIAERGADVVLTDQPAAFLSEREQICGQAAQRPGKANAAQQPVSAAPHR